MAGFDSGVNAPSGASFAPQPLSFAGFGQWAADDPAQAQARQLNALKLQQAQQQADLSKAYPNGLPIDPRTGQPDVSQVAQTFAKFGAIPEAMTMLQNQPAPLSPLLGGQAPGGQAGPTDPAVLTPKIIQNESGGNPNSKDPRSTASGLGGFTDSTWVESIKKYFPNLAAGRSDDQIIAMKKIPQLATRVTEAFTGGNQAGLQKAGLPVTPATTYLAHFAGLGGAIKVLEANPNTPVEKILGQAAMKANPFLQGMTARDLELWAAKKMQGPAMTAQNAQPQGGGAPTRVASAATGDLPPSANAGTPAPTRQPQGDQPMVQPQQQQVQPAGGAPPAQVAQVQPPQRSPAAPQQQPLVPQEPLPPGYTDPMKYVADLRAAADRLAGNQHPGAKEQAAVLNAKADRIQASIAPVKMGQYDTYVNPMDPGQVVAQGPGAAAIRGGGETGATLDADAAAYRQTGKLPPNMGRGIQGAQQATAIRTRAAEQEINEGGDPSEWSGRWQSFATQAAGKRALETRAAGLSLAENEASSLIPRVREISGKIKRSEYPSLNSLILAAQKGTGGTDVIKLGIAVESLVPVYARVLKPVGQVGQGDMARAHDILDKAWSDGQIGAALDQMQVELKSARSALDKTMSESENRNKKNKEGDSAWSSQGGGGETTEWVRGPDGKLGPAQ